MNPANQNESSFVERLVDSSKNFLDNLNPAQSLAAGCIGGLIFGYILKTFIVTFFVFWAICIVTSVLGYVQIDEDQVQALAQGIWNFLVSSRVQMSREELLKQGRVWTLHHKWVCLSFVCSFGFALFVF